MIENNYDNRINFESEKHRKPKGNTAYDKLLDYRETVERSDMCNSQTRYEGELEYIEKAIDEAQANDQSDLVKTLEGSKNKIKKLLGKLKSKSHKSSNIAKPYFVQSKPKERVYCLSNENREVFNNFTEEEISRFNKLQKETGLSDDNTVAFMLFDDKQLERFSEIRAKHKDLEINYAVNVAKLNEVQYEIFKYAINHLGLEADDAADFANMHIQNNPESKTEALRFSLSAHQELKDVIDSKVADDIAVLSTYGVDVPNMLDNNGESGNLWRGETGSLRDEVKEDIEKLAKAYKSLDYPPSAISVFSHNKVINKEIQERIKEEFLPIVGSQRDLEELETGDVFITNYDGEEKLCIAQKSRTQGKTVGYKLNMSPETYLKLFPPVLRYSSLQDDGTADCFLITTLNILYSDKSKRRHLLEKFEETPEGKIKIKLNDDLEYIYDDKNITDEKHLKGAPGMQMYEAAYGANMIYTRIANFVDDTWKEIVDEHLEKMEELENKIALAKTQEEASEYRKQIEQLEKEMEKISQDAISYINPNIDTIYDTDKNHEVRDQGGTLDKACQNMGLSDLHTHRFSSFYGLDSFISSYPGAKFYMGTKGSSDEIILDESLNLVQNHAYMLEFKDDKYYVINPWISAQRIEIPKEKIEEYGRTFLALFKN